jgi:dihydroxyacetone kinase-like predicted kinase
MISAAAEFHPGASPADNAAAMTKAAERLRTGALTESEGTSPPGAVAALVAELEASTPDPEVLTLVAGTRVTDDDLQSVTVELAGRFPALRVEILRGSTALPAYQVGLE